ncbi:MAG: hypothetical protein ACOX9E_14690 [Lentisphaeria bacterium]
MLHFPCVALPGKRRFPGKLGYERDRPPKREIDYIFVSEGIRVHSHRTIDDTDDGLCPSDHFPVMCEVTLP